MKKLGLLVFGVLLLGLTSCGGGSADKPKKEVAKATETKKEEVKEEAKKEVNESAADVDGKALFISNGCIACHKVDEKNIGPSLKDIAKGYDGDKGGLVNFLKGNAESKIDPPQFSVMKPNLEITKKMAENEVGAIADYILAQK
jgi:cytochrome c